MKLSIIVFQIVACVVSKNFANALTSEEISEVTESCCTHGEAYAMISASADQCSKGDPPDEIEPEQLDTCRSSLKSCCEIQFRQKDECSAGMKLASEKRCMSQKSDIGKICCEECSFGQLTGESQGKEACGSPAENDVSPNTALRKNAYFHCCLEAANKPETTTERRPTTEKRLETTTEKKVTTTKRVKETCKTNSCDHICNDDSDKLTCQCREGYRLQADKKSCKDINECAEAIDDLCTGKDTVCHNTPGTFKCVPIRKREVGMNCPPGFKRNVVNQVCDDINECQLPRPPCPKYLCENTIGAYKCAGKLGKPFTENAASATTEASASSTMKNDICPPGFRAGPDDECIDIDECDEHLDDCQRLSQHCINTHGNFFCQDHVSKRCAPGFKVNDATGICEDIDECEESTEVCKRSEICVNMPGAYTCKSKISTLPKLASKTCQEGTRFKPGGSICEDIDECREGSHLCDQFQNCINTYGAHECRCKNGFELDSSGSCVDIDECALKLDNCRDGTFCLNVLGSFACTRHRPAATTTTPAPAYEYEYYDSEEDNSTVDNETHRETVPPVTSTSTTTSRPTSPTTTPTPQPPLTRPPYKPSTTRKPYTSHPRPRPTTSTTRKPEIPVTPRRPPTRRPDVTVPVEVTVPTPKDPVTVEREKDPEGSYDIDTSDIPKDRWTNVIGKERTDRPESDFDPSQLHCLNGYERGPDGTCVDINECESKNLCTLQEVCRNRPGGYMCDCKPGYQRDDSGWCAVDKTTTTPRTPRPTTPRPTTPKTTTPRPTTPRPTTPRPTTPRVTTPTRPTTPRPATTSTESTESTVPDPTYTYTPRPSRPYSPRDCELGYSFDYNVGNCVDINECTTDKTNCSPHEQCVNIPGGYNCVCGSRRCRPDADRPPYVTPERPREHVNPDTNVITVGAQYGQRGPRYLRPSFSRLPNTGAVVTTCPWGYKLTPDKMCLDIDECAKNVSECGPQQRCENFYGGYSCQCPAGHKLEGQDGCEDIDECQYGQPCSYNSQCVNTLGSYKCECSRGFRNAPANERVCVDVDECAETPQVCEQGCANAWGSYRCYCKKGYRLDSDGRSCVDVDECAEWASTRLRGSLCGGQCVNEPGSYRCACPGGYRLSEDGRSCIDIDECESGEASCANAEAGQVCQNTRGSYHCHRIDCPTGYRLESKHKCTRIQRSCPVNDWTCLQQPSTYSYNFITFVANIYLPNGSVDLFTMHGPSWRDSIFNFEMKMIDVQASQGVRPANLNCFDMRPTNNMCVISLLCSLGGPQVAELELTMSLYQRGQFAGSAVARLVVIVSQYEF